MWNGMRTEPLFRPEEWSVYQRTLDGEDRTNNFSEAGMRRLKNAFSCQHPTIWHFVDVIRREQKSADADFAKFIMGEDPPPKKKKYRETDRRILNLVTEYNPLNLANIDQPINTNRIIEYLTGISRNYQMNP